MTDEDNTDDIVTLPDQLYGELLHGLQVRLAVTEPAVGAQGAGTRLEYSVQVYRCMCVQEYRCTGSRCLNFFSTLEKNRVQEILGLYFFSSHFSPMSGTLFFSRPLKIISSLYTPSQHFSAPGFWKLI